MSLSNLSFIGIYFPLLFMFYYAPFPACKSRKYRNMLLLLASLGFYAMAEPVHIGLLIVCIVINFILVRCSLSRNTKFPAAAAIVLDVAVLVFFKYINQVLSVLLLSKHISFAFPIGISYFTFQEISYVVESVKHKNRIKGGSFWDTCFYIGNFFRIVSGPLGFYDQCIGEIRDRNESWEDVYEGIYRFSIGLIKKVIIADSLAPLVIACFSTPDNSFVMAWTGALAFTVELYFDFSGYSDMAIGMGRIFGFHINENFNFPYAAQSVSDFWRRWHMSLTRWFTTYVYIPLGGSRVTAGRHILNLFVVWMCTGLWHGSHLTFVVWGMIYFVLQTLEKYTGFDKTLKRFHLQYVYTLLVIILCWVIFRSPNLSVAYGYLMTMFGQAAHFVTSSDVQALRMYVAPLIAGTILSLPVGENIIRRVVACRMLGKVWNMAAVLLFLACLILMIGKGYSAPLYAGF